MKFRKAMKEGKGEEGNVLPFDPVPKPEMKPPGGPDWLRTLKMDDRFLARKKNQPKQVYLELFGIGYITPKAVLLAYESEYGPAMTMKYVDSANFSALYDFIELLPTAIPHRDGEGTEDG